MSGITARHGVCAIFGHPVGHSLSPAIHNAAFEALSLPLVYVAHDVAPEALPAAFQAARTLGYRGLSVTIPHKVAAVALVDEVDSIAAQIGAINTVVRSGDRLLGSNSDGRGAVEALRAASADPTGRRVVLLGSGGAARAIAITMATEARPSSLEILGVVPDELERLVADTRAAGAGTTEGATLTDAAVRERLEAADILLQCTPIGMAPRDAETVVPRDALHPGLTVFDAVYTPRQTVLLRDAASAGARVVEGREMFLGQAAVQFALWTGQAAPLDVFRSALERAQ